MAMDKGLYAAPQGLDSLQSPGIEIEIEDPEAVHIDMDGLEVDLEPGGGDEEGFDDNLAEYISDKVLASLGSELVSEVDKDLADRKDWMRTYVEGLKLLGLKYEERTEPWQGACGVFHPMLTESVVRFQSEAMMETFPAMGPVSIAQSMRSCCGHCRWRVRHLKRCTTTRTKVGRLRCLSLLRILWCRMVHRVWRQPSA